MSDLPDISSLSKTELINYAEKIQSQAKENAPTTVTLSSGGTIIGAAAFGPAGGVVGATVGSSVGALMDSDYFDSDEDPETIEADVEDVN